MALSLRGVVIHYPGNEDRPALRGLSLELGVLGCVAVVGPSGSAKVRLAVP